MDAPENLVLDQIDFTNVIAYTLKSIAELCQKNDGQAEQRQVQHGKELSEDVKKNIVDLHKDGLGYKKIAKALKLSCSTVAKTVQRFNRTGSIQNRPRHGRPKKLSARAQRHIKKLSLRNRHMSAASIAAEVEEVVGQPVSAQTIRRTLHQIGLHGCRPGKKPLLQMMQEKTKQEADSMPQMDTPYPTAGTVD